MYTGASGELSNCFLFAGAASGKQFHRSTRLTGIHDDKLFERADVFEFILEKTGFDSFTVQRTSIIKPQTFCGNEIEFVINHASMSGVVKNKYILLVDLACETIKGCKYLGTSGVFVIKCLK